VSGQGSVEDTALYIISGASVVAAGALRAAHHMPYATALCMLENRAWRWRCRVRSVHDDVAYDPTYNGLRVDVSRGSAWRARWGKISAHDGNHGVLVVGKKVSAFEAVFLEAPRKRRCWRCRRAGTLQLIPEP